MLPEPEPELKLLPELLLELLQERKPKPKLLLEPKENVPDKLQPSKPELPPKLPPEPDPEPEPSNWLLRKLLQEPQPESRPWPEPELENKPGPKRELPAEPSVKTKLPAEPKLLTEPHLKLVPPHVQPPKLESASKPMSAVLILLLLHQPGPEQELKHAEMVDAPPKLLPKPGLLSELPVN